MNLLKNNVEIALTNQQLELCSRLVKKISASMCAVTLIVFTGWIFDKDVLKAINPEWASMKIQTASGFVLSALSLYLLSSRKEDVVNIKNRMLYLSSVLVTLESLLVIFEYVTKITLPIDLKGRMSLITAFNFLFCGSSLLFVKKYPNIARFLIFIPLIVSYVVILNYLFGEVAYVKHQLFSIALSTAFCFFIFGIGFLLLDIEHNFLGYIFVKNSSGIIFKKLFFTVLIFIPIFSFIRLWGQKAGWYNLEFGLSLFTVTMIVFFSFFIFETAKSINNYEKNLLETKKQAQKANQAKSAFLATMSHEIRTPINAIVGTSYLLGLTTLNKNQKRDLTTIEVASKNLLTLINDVLDFSKIEAGELTIDKQEFFLPELLSDLRVMFSAIAAEKGIEFHIPILTDNFPTLLIGDSNRVRQMLVNFINNAIKFTQRGSVNLEIKLVKKENKQITLHFAVTDTGIGITPENQQKLFQPFIQADTSTTRKFGGSGLGLSIVKLLAEMMDGHVGLKSQSGIGSTFWFEIPFEIAQSQFKPHAGINSITQPLRIIIAEDDFTDRKVLIQHCGEFGWDVECVENGKELVDKVAYYVKQNQIIDCIISDWQMPILDGVSAIHMIKEQMGEQKMPSIIMVTAYEKAELSKAIMDIAIDSILQKPIVPSTLFNSVNNAVLAHGSNLDFVLNSTIIRAQRSEWLKHVKLLVVDDNLINLDVISRILEKQGAFVTVCESGENCLAMLKSEQDYDAILMDLQMPNMDGCETTIQIRQNLKQVDIPIIALTAGATTTEQERAVSAGMNDFLTKPIAPIIVIKTLRKHIEKYRGKSIQVEAIDTIEKAEVEVLKIEELVDVEKMNINFPDDADFFKASLKKFIDEHNQLGLVNKINELINQNQYHEASRVVHKITGSSGMLCLDKLYESTSHLENILKENHVENGEMLIQKSKFEHEYNKILSISDMEIEML